MERKKLRNRILCAALCICLLCGLFSKAPMQAYAVSEQTQEKIDRAEQEKQDLEDRLETQKGEKEDLEKDKLSAEEKLEKLKKEYKSLSNDLAELEKRQKEKEEEIADKTAELEKAVRVREEQYEDMKKRIRYLYEQPQESLLTMLFTNSDIVSALDKIDSIMKIQEYDRDKLISFEEAAAAIELQKEELEAAKKELEGLVESAAKKQAEVSALQKKTGASIKSYLAQITDKEGEIGNTEADLEEKSKALKKLYAQAQAEEAAERRRQAEEAAKALQDALANGTIKPEDSGIVYGELNLTQAEMDMLTAMIYCESRGESYEGQLAVGYVIMNRVRSSKFPNSLEAVLRQNKQFEPAGSGRFDIVLTAYWGNIPGVVDMDAWNNCQKAAMVCVNSDSNVGESLFFRTHAPVPQLAENLEAAGVPFWIIGNHIFYYSWVNY